MVLVEQLQQQLREQSASAITTPATAQTSPLAAPPAWIAMKQLCAERGTATVLLLAFGLNGVTTGMKLKMVTAKRPMTFLLVPVRMILMKIETVFAMALHITSA